MSFESSQFVTDLFEVIDGEIKAIQEKSSGNLIESLSALYWRTWVGLKHISGTSAGWPWLSEYIIFYIIKSSIQSFFGAGSFVPIPPTHKLAETLESTKDIWPFVLDHEIDSPKLVLTHNAKLPGYDIHPDICVLDGKLNPLCVVEIKVNLKDKKVLPTTVARLNSINASRNCYKYIIVFDTDSTFDQDETQKHLGEYKEEGVRFIVPKGGKLYNNLLEIAKPISLEEFLVDITHIASSQMSA